MILLGAVAKERRVSDIPIPTFPACINSVFNNFLMRRFALPAMLETAAMYVLFPFLPNFVQIVLDPMAYCSDDAQYYDKLRCRSTYWIGFMVLAFVMGALLSLPCWFTAVRTLQKKTAWGISSMMQVIALPAMALPKDKYMIVPMVLFFLVGITQGNGFLQRSMLSDIIDYDELLELKRNEGLYTGIIEGLSKLTIVLAQIVPLTFMYVAGYKEPQMGVPSEQPFSVEIYIQCVDFSILIL
eukprot:TRINITY_DN7252_c0_g1_i15.p1 TRINITY_DN7252_c0_g1~~TRINITY_DN7252_c0_g1_i15.p1  ORF type:complete len:241 (-),score=49.66 TRINITY_DN7252_c0_g1_i15:261-983(-)